MIRPDTYYAILADECKDVSKRELVAVSVRYPHNGTLRERMWDLWKRAT